MLSIIYFITFCWLLRLLILFHYYNVVMRVLVCKPFYTHILKEYLQHDCSFHKVTQLCRQISSCPFKWSSGSAELRIPAVALMDGTAEEKRPAHPPWSHRVAQPRYRDRRVRGSLKQFWRSDFLGKRQRRQSCSSFRVLYLWSLFQL